MLHNRKLWATWVMACCVTLVWLAAVPSPALACPFCSAVSQTLSEEMGAMDAAAIARIVAGSETDADAEFEIISVLHGQSLIEPHQKIRVNYFGKAKPDQQFLLMGVDPPELLWSSPLPVTDAAIDYIKSLTQLPKDRLERIAFFLPYLEHSEPILARDAYDEFAKTPYPDIKSLKSQLNHAKLLEWIQDTSLPADRKRMYLVMLGVCNQPEDAELLEKLLRSEDENQRGGLDAMIACYLTLRGAAGLPLIDELFLHNKKSQYADTYAAIMALRFHGTEGGIIDKQRVLESMRLILDRPELADLVIPDLARWEDWTQIDKLSQLFKSADEKSSWVRVPVINYLRACPLPAAEQALAELKEIDPAAFKRATSFFPVPKTNAGATDSSFVPAKLPSSVVTNSVDTGAVEFGAAETAVVKTAPIAAPLPANRPLAASVVSMASVSVWLAMWLAISGPGTPAWLAPWVRRA